MNSYLQLLIIVISFLYGTLFYLLARYNMLIIKKLSTFLKYVISFVFVIDMVIIYIYLIYHINRGMFHIYFLVMIFLGYVTMNYLYKYLVKLCQKIKKKKR